MNEEKRHELMCNLDNVLGRLKPHEKVCYLKELIRETLVTGKKDLRRILSEKDPSMQVTTAFNWHKSQKGPDFWECIADRLNQ